MREIWLDPEPVAMLDALSSDPESAALWRAVEGVLDELERDPMAPMLRRRRFRDPPLWCVLVATSHDRWVVLWEEHPTRAGAIAIRHIGPASFA